MTDGRKGRKVESRSLHTATEFTETYEARRERKAQELAALKAAASKSVPRVGRPKVLVSGTDKGRRFVELWNAGTKIKIIAEELGVSEKAVKNARPHFKLKTRRPDLGKGTQFRMAIDAQTLKLLRAACTRKGCSKATYIRELIRRDAGL